MTIALARRDTAQPPDGGTTFQALVAAAKDLISRDGYHSVTVEDIRPAAGVSRASFYFYFRSKQAIFLEVAGRVVDDLYEVAGKHYPDRTEYERIVLANAEYLRAWSRERRILGEIYALHFVDAELGSLYRRNRLRFADRIEQRLRHLRDHGRIPDSDLRLLTITLAGSVEAFVNRYFAQAPDGLEGEFPFATAIETISTVWYRAVYGKEPPHFSYQDLVGCTHSE